MLIINPSRRYRYKSTHYVLRHYEIPQYYKSYHVIFLNYTIGRLTYHITFLLNKYCPKIKLHTPKKSIKLYTLWPFSVDFFFLFYFEFINLSHKFIFVGIDLNKEMPYSFRRFNKTKAAQAVLQTGELLYLIFSEFDHQDDLFSCLFINSLWAVVRATKPLFFFSSRSRRFKGCMSVIYNM
jgi:hypothetical protein